MITQEVGRRLQLELGVDPRQHQCRPDRLGDVVDRAQLQAMNLVLGAGHGGEENDRNFAGMRIVLETPGHFMPGQPRHHHVQQDQVRQRVTLEQAQGFFPAIGDLDPIAILEQVGHQQQVIGRVVDHQQGRTGVMTRLAIHRRPLPRQTLASPGGISSLALESVVAVLRTCRTVACGKEREFPGSFLSFATISERHRHRRLRLAQSADTSLVLNHPSQPA